MKRPDLRLMCMNVPHIYINSEMTNLYCVCVCMCVCVCVCVCAFLYIYTYILSSHIQILHIMALNHVHGLSSNDKLTYLSCICVISHIVFHVLHLFEQFHHTGPTCGG